MAQSPADSTLVELAAVRAVQKSANDSVVVVDPDYLPDYRGGIRRAVEPRERRRADELHSRSGAKSGKLHEHVECVGKDRVRVCRVTGFARAVTLGRPTFNGDTAHIAVVVRTPRKEPGALQPYSTRRMSLVVSRQDGVWTVVIVLERSMS